MLHSPTTSMPPAFPGGLWTSDYTMAAVQMVLLFALSTIINAGWSPLEERRLVPRPSVKPLASPDILQSDRDGGVSPPLTGWPYTSVWDSPTILCERFKLDFDLSQYLIVQNEGRAFDGNRITLLYQLGEFPRVDGGKAINGGIPQLGNLSLHLELLRRDVDLLIPSKDFNGLAIMDFEAWRPIFEHNFDSLKNYQELSEKLVEKMHPEWNNKTEIMEEAKKEFEMAARLFFEATINETKRLRPQGYWGYYGFPRCYGAPVANICTSAQADNDQLQWLWDASTALYPSIYLAEGMSQTEKVLLLMSNVHEGVRVANSRTDNQSIPVYPFSKHTYRKEPGHFYSKEDMWLSQSISSYLGSTGVVIWGSTHSTDNATLCTDLYAYITGTMGPIIKDFTEWTQNCSLELCSGHGQCVVGEIPSWDVIES